MFPFLPDGVVIFQFTPLREGRHMPKSTPCKNPLFQFTPLREGRPALLQPTIGFCVFQFTPLREGRLSSSSRRQMPLRYFNSRPCGRGDRRARNHLCYACCISIHAPAGGATISAPRTAHSTLFQFTPLREGRPVPIPNLRTGETISIHAPAGGATELDGATYPIELFQFTPLREGRLST